MSKETENSVKEEVFNIILDEVEPYPSVMNQNIVTSTSLAHMIAKVFEIYDDFKGVKIDVRTDGAIMISSYFNHYDYTPDSIVAFSKAVSDSAKSESMERIRRQRKTVEDGIRYYITKEGKEGIEEFMIFKNNKGKVNWQQCVADIALPIQSLSSAQESVSVINGLDPKKLLKAIYGSSDEEGEYEYDIRVLSSKPSAFANKEYIFSIERYNKTEIDRAARDTGIIVGNVLGIMK